MNKKVWLLILVLVAAFLLSAVSIVSSKPGSAGMIDCVLDITYNEYEEGVFYWLGTVTGDDCDVEGTIRFDAVDEEYTFPGKTMHFVEEFTTGPTVGAGLKEKIGGFGT